MCLRCLSPPLAPNLHLRCCVRGLDHALLLCRLSFSLTFYAVLVRVAARHGVWVQQRDGTMFSIGEDSLAAMLELCQR